jgi:hypothetical protein
MLVVPEDGARWSLVASTVSATGRISHRCSNESINRHPTRYEAGESEHLAAHKSNKYGCKTTLIYVHYAQSKFN